MKKLFFTLIFSALFFTLSAQDFEILSVESLPADFSAREEMKTDHGGHQCALLRIATQKISPEQREGFIFKTDLGSELVERASRVGEIWLWVSPGLKNLRIMHPDLGQYEIRMIDYVTRVEPLHTYKIILKGPDAQPGPVPDKTPKKQFLAFQVTPANATLEVNGEVWSLDASGGAFQYMDIGVPYTYRVRATDYFAEEGTVTIDDPANTKVVPVTLRPNSASVTFKVDSDAEIWIDNNYKGTRTWTGKLGSRTYKVECRQAGHEPSVTTQEITVAMDGQTVNLPAPTPIYGSLMVQSVPGFCKLFIDGKDCGTTPKSVNEILIGSHEIRLTKEGYADYTEKVTIAKGESKQVNATLSNGKEIQFTCNVPDAQLEIDGKVVGQASSTYMLTYGSHSLRATTSDYQDYTATLSVSANGDNGYSIQMKSLPEVEETFTVNGVSFTMKLVEGGTFQMGATKEQGSDAKAEEKPVHSVTLSNYYMGETEVTQALWQAVMGSNPSNFKGDNPPVKMVSWNDCQDFIRKLNQLTGRNFRLPTEAEWEYAARGGKKSSGNKYAGSNSIDNVAWYTRTTNDSGTRTVKTKLPNELGLYDMSGNVWEWCQDWYGNYSSSSQTNPTGPSSGSFRVLRGGSWYSNARYCRVSYRYSYVPDYGNSSYGFRLCLPQ